MSAPAPSPFHMIFSPTYNTNEIGNEHRSSEDYGSPKEAEDADDDHLYSDLDEPDEGKDGSRMREISPDRDVCHLHYSDDTVDHISRSLSTSHEELPIALARVSELEEEVKKLKSENESYLKEKSVLEKNFSSLLMTARANLERKDRQLRELQKELDNVVFRRGKANNRISQEAIEKLAEEKARTKVEALMKAIPKETKDGDIIVLKDHTNCQVAMGNVTVSFVTDHFDFSAIRKRPVKESRTELPRNDELPKPRTTSSGTDKKTPNAQPSTSKAHDEVKPRKPSQPTKSALSKTSASMEYSKEHKTPAISRDEAYSVPENSVVSKSPCKSRASSSRLPSSPRKRAREDSGGSKLDRKRRMTVKEYNNRKNDTNTSQNESIKAQSSENVAILEPISPVPSTSQVPVENGIPGSTSQNMPSAGMLMSTSVSDISPPVENPERTQTPLVNTLVKLDNSKNTVTKEATSVFFAVSSHSSKNSEINESLQSLVAAAADIWAKMPPLPDPKHGIPETSPENLLKKSLTCLEGELEDGELPDTEDISDVQQASSEENRDRNICRSPQLESAKNRSSRTQTGNRDRTSRRERSPRRRDESVSHRTSELAKSSHSSSRSSYTSSQLYKYKNRRTTKLNSTPASNHSRIQEKPQYEIR